MVHQTGVGQAGSTEFELKINHTLKGSELNLTCPCANEIVKLYAGKLY